MAKKVTDKKEVLIEQYKTFYKKHFIQIKNRQELLSKLYPLCLKFQDKRPATILVADNEGIKLEEEAVQLIKAHLNEDILGLFMKEFDSPDISKREVNEDDSLIHQILGGISTLMEELKKHYQIVWKYRTDFLIFINNCIANYGLHRNIYDRDPVIYKRYNLLIKHYYRSSQPLYDYKFFLTYDQFQSQFTKLYIKQSPIKFAGKLIPFESIEEVKITTCLFLDDEIDLYAIKNNFRWDASFKDIKKFIESCEDETEKYHPNPFDDTHKEIDLILVNETLNYLVPFPPVQKQYRSALEKYQKKVYQRNLLDDLRLALELLLKGVFKNRKSLENQVSNVGNIQKKNGASTELTNMFQKLLDYYSKYQNEYVKHNDVVNSNEIDIMFNLTSTFLIYIVKLEV